MRSIIVTLAEGEITELHVGLKGTMNALFLKDLVMNTHRTFALPEISAAFPCRIKISSAKNTVDYAAPIAASIQDHEKRCWHPRRRDVSPRAPELRAFTELWQL